MSKKNFSELPIRQYIKCRSDACSHLSIEFLNVALTQNNLQRTVHPSDEALHSPHDAVVAMNNRLCPRL